jgi:arylsulfatase A-like enzyme
VNIGKMHTVPMDAPCGFDQRFVVENKDRPLRLDRPHGGFHDEWDRFLAHNGVRKPSRHTYRAEDPEYETALGAYAWPLEERYHPDVFVGNTARWFIEQRASDSPLFLQVGFPGPHPPYDPPRRLIESYLDTRFPPPEVTEEELAGQPSPLRAYRQEMVRGNHDAVRWRERPAPDRLERLRRHYAANVSLIDEQIGLLLDALRERGILEDAVVIFMSDHGDCLGDHGHIQKWTMYDCVTRVPLVLWGPDRVPAGRRVDALVQHMDVAAGLFDLIGLPAPEDCEALSVLPLLDGAEGGREIVFAEHSADNILKQVSFVTMARTREHKLVHYLDQDWGELYDLRADPHERVNLWHDPARASERRRLLDAVRDWRIRGTLPR